MTQGSESDVQPLDDTDTGSSKVDDSDEFIQKNENGDV